ncbi:MAG TPA: acyl carrier protein [Lentisphaeria bacterium]|nr:MAG: acyl carrier protein [Lentisphaerae bacterium GWF2_49_21]HBC87405.1 acyl carrier protein [Lentisphaeria bacterium]
MASIEEKVKKVIIANLCIPEEQIRPESRFIEDLGADSLSIVEIVMALEEEFGFDIPDEEVDKMKTYGLVIQYLKEKVKDG